MTYETVKEVYRTFLEIVVRDHVFSDAERALGGRSLGDGERKDIGKGKKIDGRAPYLARVSGKGGWVENTEKARDYARYTNVSLLDHLASVVRGAITLAWMDIRADERTSEAEKTPEAMRPRLARIAAAAFLHDLDKILGCERSHQLTVKNVSDTMVRFGIGKFLAAFGQSIEPAQMLSAIHAAESSRDGESSPQSRALDREFHRDLATYARLADRLDGIFLDTWPEGGIDGALRELETFDAGQRSNAFRNWRLVRINDPHTPFLMEELLAGLSVKCKERHGHPPLIEIHHDGRLLCLIPLKDSDALIDDALAVATRLIGAEMGMRVDFNEQKWSVDLADAPGNFNDLKQIVEDMETSRRERLIHISTKRAMDSVVRKNIDDIFSLRNIAPKWPRFKKGNNRIPIWSGTDVEDIWATRFHKDASVICILLSCADDENKKSNILTRSTREKELRAYFASKSVSVPDWVADEKGIDRWPLLAALAAAVGVNDEGFRDGLLGSQGLMKVWLEGDGEARPGLVAKIPESGTALAGAVTAHYRALMSQTLVRAADESLPWRCHFTNQPVAETAEITTKTALYGVNVSAFSGRMGRPESFGSSSIRGTWVAATAEAEHRLRRKLFESAKKEKVPVLVSSPSASGLFGALLFDRANDDRSFFDILRLKQEGKTTFSDVEGLGTRVRIGRYEVMPTRLTKVDNKSGQISFVKMALECALRVGRPIHVFRGLPMLNPAFVAFDFLPPAIGAALQGREFRLEQIPEKIRLLRGLEAIAEQTGFGVELALAVADPATRFAAACDALSRYEKMPDADQGKVRAIWKIAKTLIEESLPMATPTDNALVAFGHAIAQVQRPQYGKDGETVSETCIREALDTAEEMTRIGQNSDETLIAAIAGNISKHLKRRDLFLWALSDEQKHDALSAAAAIFVVQVWNGAFEGQSPSSRLRRTVIATFRWAFLSEARKRDLARKKSKKMEESTA